MLSEEQRIKMLEETRQADVSAMLLAIILIERGQHQEAVQALLERIPPDLSAPLQKARA